jgi:dynein heavy chain 1
MGDSLEGGTGDGPAVAESVAVVECSTFATYLKKAVTILLPEDEDVISPALTAALSDRNNQDCIQKFLSDPQVSCLLIQRASSKGWLLVDRQKKINGTVTLNLVNTVPVILTAANL